MKTSITIPAIPVQLVAKVNVGEDAIGLMVVGFTREKHHLCDRLVLEEAHKNHFGTVTAELLTADEALEDQRRLNVELLAERLIAVTHWLQDHPITRSLPLAYYGRGNLAATILRTAAGLQHQIKALVAVGGDPQAALPVLYQVTAPTLFIIGEVGDQILKRTKEALEMLTAEKSMKIISKSDQSFADPLKAAEVAMLTADWFKKHLMTMSWNGRDKVKQ